MPARPQSLQQAVATGAASFAVIAFTGVTGAVLTARVFGASVVGQYALAYAPTGILFFLSNAREQAALSRELATTSPRTPAGTSIFIATLAFSASLTLAAGLVVVPVGEALLSGPLNAGDLVRPSVAVALAYWLFYNTSWSIDTLLSTQRAASALFWVRLNVSLTGTVVALVLALATHTVWALVLGYAAAGACGLAHRCFYARRLLTSRITAQDFRDSRSRLARMIKWSIRLAPAGVMDGVSKESVTWLVGLSLPLAAVGSYNRAWTLSSRMLDLHYRVVELMFPTLVRRRSDGDHSGAHRGLTRAMRLVVVILLWPAAVVGGASAGVMGVFGHAFVRGAGCLTLLVLVPVFLAISALSGYGLMAYDATRVVNRLVVTRAVLVMVSLPALIVALGLTGAGIGMALAYGAEAATTVTICRARLDGFRGIASLGPWRLALVYALTLVTSRAVDDALGEAIPSTLAVLVLGSVMFWGALILLRWFDDVERAGIGQMWRRIGASALERAHRT